MRKLKAWLGLLSLGKTFTNCCFHFISLNKNPVTHLLSLFAVLQTWFSCDRLGMRFFGRSKYSFGSTATDMVAGTTYISSSIRLLVSCLYFSQIDVSVTFVACAYFMIK